METLIIILIAISLVLFLISFFLPDATKELKEEIEQLSLKVYQDSFKTEKRLKVLEEELLLPTSVDSLDPYSQIEGQQARQRELLHKQGFSNAESPDIDGMINSFKGDRLR